jgi:hypothetical protein
MPETSKKAMPKKNKAATTTTSDSQRIAANAPKGRVSKAKASKKTTAQAPAKVVTKVAPKKEVASETHIHYTTEPSKFRTRLNGAGRSSVRAVRRPKFWMIAAGAAVTIFMVLLLWWQWQRSYIAVVGGQYLPVSMIDDQLRANYGSNGIDSVIQQQLILQEGARQHVNITDKQISDELAKIKNSSGGQTSYSAQLKQLGISESLLQYQVRVQLTRESLLKDKIQVSDKEISDYYDQNKDSIDPGGKTGLDALKSQIHQTLKQQKLDGATTDYVTSLRQRTHVETDLGHLSLTFGDFLSQTIWPIPTDAWNFVSGKK